jgi:hypothetical protein
MAVMYWVSTILTAAVVTFSGAAKLARDPKVVKVVHELVGVPLRYLPALAACEFAGAAGLVAGFWWPALGVTAAIGLVIYFVVAVISHLRVGDLAGIGPAVFVLALAAASLGTRLATM